MIIGIDTSCYTTSLSIINDDGLIYKDLRLLLEVKPGEKGLRQSEAIFQHISNLPRLFEGFQEQVKISAVAASCFPRPVDGSYLPVFKVGAAFGESIAKLFGVPFFPTSHQEGHIRAGLYEQQQPEAAFLAWHISGGTTELLLVTPGKGGYRIEKIGGTSDLQVGQFVDRVGVALGAPFPAGPYLEKLATGSEDVKKSLPVVTNEFTLSFSGPESAAQRLVGKIPDQELARQVINCIWKSLFEVTALAVKQFGINKVLLVGGVASNQLIRQALTESGNRNQINFLFANPKLSSDNAVGVGLIGSDLYHYHLLK